MRRDWVACLLNILVPGTGLVWLGRPWLGLSLAVWFALSVEVALCGWLIAPATIPWAITGLAGVLAASAWLVGMAVLMLRLRMLHDRNLDVELERMREHALEAMARGDLRSANAVLRIALSLDDAHLETQILWARVLTELGRKKSARRAWRGASRLDEEDRYGAEIHQAIQKLEAS